MRNRNRTIHAVPIRNNLSEPRSISKRSYGSGSIGLNSESENLMDLSSSAPRMVWATENPTNGADCWIIFATASQHDVELTGIDLSRLSRRLFSKSPRRRWFVLSMPRGRPPFPLERRPNSLVSSSFNPSLAEKGRGRSFWLEAPWGHAL